MINNDKDVLSVLIADDVAQNRAYFASLLREVTPNLTITEAENGKDAVAQVANHIQKRGRSFDLIIMDYRMPELNGADATAAIRELEATSTTPSVLITWSTSLQSPYPKADDWLPKMTNKNEVKAKLMLFDLLRGD